MPSIACISDVFPLPTAPQTPSKVPSFKDIVMLCRVSTMSTFSANGASSDSISLSLSPLVPEPLFLTTLPLAFPAKANHQIQHYHLLVREKIKKTRDR